MTANRRPGGVPLARFEPVSVDMSPAIGTPVGNTAGDMERIGYRLRSLSATIGRVADERATREGQEAGAVAGMDPEFRQIERNTVYARAFNQTGNHVALSQLETQARREMEGVYAEHGHDPDALGRGLDDLRSQLDLSAPLQGSPVLRARFGEMFDRNRLVYERQTARATVAAAEAGARADIETANTQRLNDLDRMARQAGLDEAADAALSGELAAMEEALLAYGPREAFSLGERDFEPDAERAGALSPEEIARQMGSARRILASGRVLGAFSRTNGVSAQSEFRDAFLADAEATDGPYADLSRQDINAIDAAMSRTIARGQAELDRQIAARERVLDRALRDAVEVTGEGLPLGADVFERIAREAGAIGAADLAAEAREASGLAQLADWAWTRPLAELEALENEQRARLQDTGSATPYQARQLATLGRVRTQLQSGLANDPLSTAVRAGVAEVPPLNMLDEAGVPSMEILTQSLAERAATARVVAANYGLASPRYFTGAERRQLTEAVGAGDVERFAMARSIVDALGPDAPQALGEIAPDEPSLAHLGGLLTAGATAAAEDMARGLQLRDVDGWESRLPRTNDAAAGGNTLAEIQLAFFGDMGESLPETAAAVTLAAGNIYDARATRQGLTRDDFNRDLYERALNEALGAVFLSDGRRQVQFGGMGEMDGRGLFGRDYPLIAPNWLRADRLGDVLGGLGDDDLAALPGRPRDGGGEPLTAEDLRGAYFLPAGQGRYFIGFGRRNAVNPTVALDETGAPYELDLAALRGRISTQHPDWVR